MSEVKWIKISTGIFDDEKIKLIEAMPESDGILVIWIKLLTLAGRQNDHGDIFVSDSMPYTDTMLAQVFNRKLATVKLALKVFEGYEMIEIRENSRISIVNWSKHQNIDGLDKIRESGRERQQRLRERKKLLTLEEGEEDKSRVEGNVMSNVTVTLPKPNKSKPSSVEEVIEYCSTLGLPKKDGEFFWHRWESNGFTLNGKDKMKDWGGVVRQYRSAGWCPSQKDAKALQPRPKSNSCL